MIIASKAEDIDYVQQYVDLLDAYDTYSDLYDVGDNDYWYQPDLDVTFIQYIDNYGYRASIFGAERHYELKVFTNGEEVSTKMYNSLKGAKIAMQRMSDTWKIDSYNVI